MIPDYDQCEGESRIEGTRKNNICATGIILLTNMNSNDKLIVVKLEQRPNLDNSSVTTISLEIYSVLCT